MPNAVQDADESEREQQLDAIIAEYYRMPTSVEHTSQDAIILRYPSFASELRQFFSDTRFLQGQDFSYPQSNDPGSPVTSGNSSRPVTSAAKPIERTSNDSLQTFGEYELLQEIARGGMGIVYKARDLKLNRIVALKMILAGELASELDVKRFRTEAESAAKLDHPGIVHVFEVGEHCGQHFFSMAFIDGCSLADKIALSFLPAWDAATLTLKISEAVSYAHDHGVIHRDLKPANILLDRFEQPKVTDFGLAKMLGTDSNLTVTGQILGTPSYMAPEQARGPVTDIGPAADTYALGAILYCCLTGRPPFQSKNILDTLFEVLESEPTPPRALVASIPLDLESICLKCLAKEPNTRYASAHEFAADLRRFIAGEPLHAASLSHMRRLFVWTRNRPALFVTWICLAAMYANHCLFAHILRIPEHRGWFSTFTTLLVAFWASVACYFQWRLSRDPNDRVVRIAWPVSEVVLLFIFLLGAGGTASSISAAFFILIAGAALREPIKLIWYITLLSIAAYVALQLHTIATRPDNAVPLATFISTIIVMLSIGLIQFTLIHNRTIRTTRRVSEG